MYDHCSYWRDGSSSWGEAECSLSFRRPAIFADGALLYSKYEVYLSIFLYIDDLDSLCPPLDARQSSPLNLISIPPALCMYIVS